jgi:hypothetical protein
MKCQWWRTSLSTQVRSWNLEHPCDPVLTPTGKLWTHICALCLCYVTFHKLVVNEVSLKQIFLRFFLVPHANYHSTVSPWSPCHKVCSSLEQAVHYHILTLSRWRFHLLCLNWIRNRFVFMWNLLHAQKYHLLCLWEFKIM